MPEHPGIAVRPGENDSPALAPKSPVHFSNQDARLKMVAKATKTTNMVALATTLVVEMSHNT
jgi:hypothetical protein